MIHGFVVGLVLLVTGQRILHAVTPPGEDPVVVRSIRWALVVKLLAAPVYLYVAKRYYDDVADYTLYHDQGVLLADEFRAGRFPTDVGPIIGLGATYIATGIVYALVGESVTAGALVFSFVAFWGLYLLYRAARLAVPELDRRRATLLVFFLPTAVYWSSTIGKDALMLFALGVGALGGARLLSGRRGGFTILTLGMAGGAFIRPHVALVLFVAVGVAYLVRRDPRRRAAEPVLRLVGIGVMAVGGLVLADRVASYLSVERLDLAAVDEALRDVADETSTGSIYAEQSDNGYGSSYEPEGFGSPLRLPIAVVTVLFRPFPYEAGNAAALATSLEGVALVALVVASRKRLAHLLRRSRDRPLVAAIVVYGLVFCYLFASIGNFGLLARQRVQLLPFAVLLLAGPPVVAATGRKVARGRPARLAPRRSARAG